jgi:hypothetical protein
MTTKEGGENQVVSAVAAFNKLLDTDPDGERRHLRRLWLESKAWGDARPAAMATILKTVRKHWNTGVGIEMWDDEA